MEGEAGEEGVNTRALAELFRLVGVRRERIGNVEVQGSMLEIYNDQIYDLLEPNKGPKGLDLKEVGGSRIVGIICIGVVGPVFVPRLLLWYDGCRFTSACGLKVCDSKCPKSIKLPICSQQAPHELGVQSMFLLVLLTPAAVVSCLIHAY